MDARTAGMPPLSPHPRIQGNVVNIVRVHLATNTRIIVAVRPNAEAAVELVTTLNKHAVGYLFRAEES